MNFEDFLNENKGLNTYIFQSHQSGYWGSSPLGKFKKIKAASKNEAEMIAMRIPSKRLKNGDTVSWRYEEAQDK